MAGQLLVVAPPALDTNASPYSGAKWYFYQSGTSTPLAVYADAGLTTSLGAVVTADSAGRFVPIYLDPQSSYRAVLKNSDGSATLSDIDPVNSDTVSQFAGSEGASLIGTADGGTVQEGQSRGIRSVRAVIERLRVNASAVSILCIGDSVTYGTDFVSADRLPPSPGHSATRATIQYPPAMQEALRETFATTSITVTNYGYSGDTAKTGYDRWLTLPSADLAIVMYGINDGVTVAGLPEYVEYMSKWVDRLLAQGTAVCICISTRRNAGAENEVVEQYRNAAEMIARTRGCGLIDVSRFNLGYKYADIYSDTTHFNGSGYKILGRKIAWALCASTCPAVISGDSVLGVGPDAAVTNGFRYATANSYAYAGGNLRISDSQYVEWFFDLDNDATHIYVNALIEGGMVVSIDGDLPRSGGIRAASANVTSAGFTVSASSANKIGALYLGTIYGRGMHSVRLVAAATADISYVGNLELVACDGMGRVNGEFSLYDPPIAGPVPAASSNTTITIPAAMLAEVVRTVGRYWFSSSYARISLRHVASAGAGDSFAEYIVALNVSGLQVLPIVETGASICKLVSVTGPADASATTPFVLTLDRPATGWLQVNVKVADSTESRFPARA